MGKSIKQLEVRRRVLLETAITANPGSREKIVTLQPFYYF
jgi:hypothetical protein